MKLQLSELFLISMLLIAIGSCKKDDDTGSPDPETPSLIFVFKFDSTQARLNSFGQPTALPSNHGAQSPVFNKMSAHYIELAPDANTLLGQGEIVYHNEETNAGGSTAINFSKSTPVGNNEIFYQIPLKDIKPGTYKWLRVSLAYQNYDIKFRFNYLGQNIDASGTIASFIGYNTYVTSYKIKDSTVALNSNKLQGYWAFETIYNVSQGQAPPGATTVPNPLFNSSPVPQGSCVVTGVIESDLVITGNETQHKVITVSLSTNKSFEWEENSSAGYFEPAAGDVVVDMGVRGLKVY